VAAVGLRGLVAVAGVDRLGQRHGVGRPSAEEPWGRYRPPGGVCSCGTSGVNALCPRLCFAARTPEGKYC